MDQVTSTDGTPIAFARSGSGPPLVLVHGGVSDHTRWRPVLAPLEARFTVLAMDRRGRGASGDSPDYDLALEYEDVAAVVRAAGEGACLLGHSFGALCALEAALPSGNLTHLILYEPPFAPDGSPIFDPSTMKRMAASLAAGDREGVLTTFYREIVRLPDAAVAEIRSGPTWPGRLAAAHTIVREGAIARYRYEPGRFAALTVPTLLITGETSAPQMSAAKYALHEALPDARLAVMPGQGHMAIDAAPEAFVRLVTDFTGR